MSDDGLDAGMQQDEWFGADKEKPITKLEGWQILHAITEIHKSYRDTEMLLSQIKTELVTIKLGVVGIALMIAIKLWQG
jgi:hypothetical protein